VDLVVSFFSRVGLGKFKIAKSQNRKTKQKLKTLLQAQKPDTANPLPFISENTYN